MSTDGQTKLRPPTVYTHTQAVKAKKRIHIFSGNLFLNFRQVFRYAANDGTLNEIPILYVWKLIKQRLKRQVRIRR
jgi:hypothetical protein